jgi:hypothetical protein
VLGPEGVDDIENLIKAGLAHGSMMRAEANRDDKLDDLARRLIERYPDHADVITFEWQAELIHMLGCEPREASRIARIGGG